MLTFDQKKAVAVRLEAAKRMEARTFAAVQSKNNAVMWLREALHAQDAGLALMRLKFAAGWLEDAVVADWGCK